jgi:hypothetical protein
LLTASSALALDIYFDQVTSAAGGALGIVGGPVGGFVGGFLGKKIGEKIHPRPRHIDNSDLLSHPHVTPINDGPMVNPPVEDRAVDSTPVRMVELRPEETDAQTYLASAPAPAREARAYRVSTRHRIRPSQAETYLTSAPSRADAAPRAIPVSQTTEASAGGQPGTLDYQLSQLNARRQAEGQPQIQTVADVR